MKLKVMLAIKLKGSMDPFFIWKSWSNICMKDITQEIKINIIGDAHVVNNSASRIQVARIKVSTLKETSQWLDMKANGIYVLLDDSSRAYIGETDEFSNRIKDHLKKRDWVQWILMIQSTDTNNRLNKSEQYAIEMSLIEKFKSLEYEVENKTSGTKYTLSGIETKKIEFDINQIYMQIDLISPKILLNRLQDSMSFIQELSVVDFLEGNSIEVKAGKKGVSEFSGMFNVETNTLIVQRGSTFTYKPRDGEEASNLYKKIFNRLEKEDKLTFSENIYTFKEDHKFNSPSYAGVLAMGGNNNGWDTWKDLKGKKIATYRK